MKKLLIALFVIFPMFCFSQNKIMTLKSDIYTIDKGGLLKEYNESIKIKLYDNELKIHKTDRLTSETIKLKDLKVSADKSSFTAKIDDDSKHSKYVTFVDNQLYIEYKRYVKIFKINK